MLRPYFRKSWGGFIAAGLFVALAVAAFCWLFFVASKNPADSGESGILLLVFVIPWIGILPREWLSGWAALACFFLNVLILYSVFGGLRFRFSKPNPDIGEEGDP